MRGEGQRDGCNAEQMIFCCKKKKSIAAALTSGIYHCMKIVVYRQWWIDKMQNFDWLNTSLEAWIYNVTLMTDRVMTQALEAKSQDTLFVLCFCSLMSFSLRRPWHLNVGLIERDISHWLWCLVKRWWFIYIFLKYSSGLFLITRPDKIMWFMCFYFHSSSRRECSRIWVRLISWHNIILVLHIMQNVPYQCESFFWYLFVLFLIRINGGNYEN